MFIPQKERYLALDYCSGGLLLYSRLIAPRITCTTSVLLDRSDFKGGRMLFLTHIQYQQTTLCVY